jgi:hypothetical protein
LRRQRELESLALASWCARTGVWRPLVPDGAAPAGRWPRTNWRAPTDFFSASCGPSFSGMDT